MQSTTQPNNPLPTLTEIVRADYRTADVFRKWGLNYCCGGNLSLEEACAKRGVDMAQVQQEVAAATTTTTLPNNLRYSEWPLPFLMDYIIQIHHGYLNVTLPLLQQLLTRFVAGHRKRYPYLTEVETLFTGLADELQVQMQKVEENIFPYIRHLSHAHNRQETYGPLLVRTMRQPLAHAVSADAERLTNLLLALRNRTAGYQITADACTNHQVIYHKLRELDANVQRQVHLQADVLYPRALQLENTLLQV